MRTFFLSLVGFVESGTAFSYDVPQKSNHSSYGHKPTVTIATKNINEEVGIRVRDNGNGMSAAVKEKIFQHFFTTKPRGEGTRLGLFTGL